jgi:hypothetical protein
MALFKRWSDRRRIRKLAHSWQDFKAALEPWLGAEETPPDYREQDFLRVKSRIAQQVPVLGQVYGRRPLEQESIAAQRDMTELMNRLTALSDATALGAAEREELLREWHVLYIFLNKLEGSLTGGTADGVVLADGALPELEQGIAREPQVRPRSSFAGFVARAVVVAALIVAIAMIFGIDDEIRSWFADPADSRGAAVAQAPTGETEVPAPSAPLLSHNFHMPRLVQPVLMRYGTAGISVLCGALLVGTLVLLRVRSR